jgi:hypothetical protein
MMARGPMRSMMRPTGMPVNAAASRPIENAAMIVCRDQPVSSAMDTDSTGKA